MRKWRLLEIIHTFSLEHNFTQKQTKLRFVWQCCVVWNPKFLTFLNNFQCLQRMVINPIFAGNPIKNRHRCTRGALMQFMKRGRKAHRRKNERSDDDAKSLTINTLSLRVCRYFLQYCLGHFNTINLFTNEKDRMKTRCTMYKERD